MITAESETGLEAAVEFAQERAVDFESFRFNAMGTVCQVDFEARSVAAAREFQAWTLAWVTRFEQRFSRFRPDSLVARINAEAGGDWVPIDSETESLLALCDTFHRTTRGAFDPAVLPLLDLWDYRVRDARPPAADAVARAMECCGWDKVQRRAGQVRLTRPGMGLDLGGIGKEYAVDCVMQEGIRRGMGSMLVNFGHDLRVRGQAPEGGAWRIGLEDPSDPGRCWDGLALRDRAVTTSGDYLRHFESEGRRYGHILDPRTGWPVSNGCQAVTVVAPTCTEAGLLSTAAFILGAGEGIDLLETHYEAHGCIWHENKRHETRRFHEFLING